MKKLPTLPSALLRAALRDLKACEADNGYDISMVAWHSPGNPNCSVCLAGSVMAQSLGAKPGSMYHPTDFDTGVTACLLALNMFRVGYIGVALRHLNKPIMMGDIEVVEYAEDKELFHIQLNTLANDLEELGI